MRVTAIAADLGERVREDRGGLLERDAVLAPVRRGLAPAPHDVRPSTTSVSPSSSTVSAYLDGTRREFLQSRDDG